MSGDKPTTVHLTSVQATNFAKSLLKAAGAPAAAARAVAVALVDADLSGKRTHGLMQLPNYLRRLQAGTISTEEQLRVVQEAGATAVCDARLMLGHHGAALAMAKAVDIAGHNGIGLVAVRNATHFGVGGSYARQASLSGMIGIAMCNTRPMMAAPGGSDPVVGNNPLAIAIPANPNPIVVDLSFSASSMGRIRLLAASGEALPPGLALNRDGFPAQTAQDALDGALLPIGGPKGFGLALAIDLICGLLSGGSMGSELQSMFSDPATDADCAWLFVAINLSAFANPSAMQRRAEALARQIEEGPLAAGSTGIRLPGRRIPESSAGRNEEVLILKTLLDELNGLASKLGVSSVH